MQPADLARWFPSARLAQIGDEIADGARRPGLDQTVPLSLFEGPRVDFSLARISHYTGTPADHVQPYILFTNYIRYVDEFVGWALSELQPEDSPYEALSAAGRVLVTRDTAEPERLVQEAGWRKHADAGLSPDRDGRQRRDAGEYRRRAIKRQEYLRSPRRAAPAGLADDRPLRRAAPQPDRSATMCWPTPICATTTCWTTCCRWRSPMPAIAEVQRGAVRGGQGGDRRGGRCAQAAAAHRHGGDHGRSQLGAALHACRRCASTRAARSPSTWRAPPSRRRAIASACPMGRCSACRTSRSTARSSCRGRPIASTNGRSASICRIGLETVELLRAGRIEAAQPQAPQLRRAALQIISAG